MTEPAAARSPFRPEAVAAYSAGRGRQAAPGVPRVSPWPAAVLVLLAAAVTFAVTAVRVPQYTEALPLDTGALRPRCLIVSPGPGPLLGRPVRVIREGRTDRAVVARTQKLFTHRQLTDAGLPPDTPLPAVIAELGAVEGGAAHAGRSPGSVRPPRVVVETARPTLLAVLVEGVT